MNNFKKYFILIIFLSFFFLMSCEAAHTHNYNVKEVVKPTCTERGYTLFSCECGEMYKDDFVDCLNHMYGSWEVVKEASETEVGSAKRVCLNDATHEETKEIPNLKDTSVWKLEEVLPTCTEDGEKVYTSEYGEVRIAVKALEHNYNDYGCHKECSLCEDYIEGAGYTLAFTLSNDSTYYIVTGISGGCEKCIKTIEIPLTHNDLPVSEIKENAFANYSSIENIIVSDNIIKVGKNLFSGYATYKYNEYDNAYYLGNAFNPYLLLVKAKSTNINSCEIHPDTKIIYEQAFKDCSYLRSIIIPDSVVYISDKVFENCNALEELTIPFVGNSVTGEGNPSLGSLFTTKGMWDNTLTVPSTLIKVVVTGDYLNDYAFYNCDNIVRISLLGDIKEIGESAFYSCRSLREVNIPETVTYIKKEAFYGCDTLENIQFPENLETIGEKAFNRCTNLKELILPMKLNSIGNLAFGGCNNIKRLVIPFVGNDKTSNSGNLNSVFGELPSSLTKIELTAGTVLAAETFKECVYLTEVILPETLECINEKAFYDCKSLKNIVIPNSVTYIGDYAFFRCKSLEHITLSTNLETIGKNSFEECISLTELILPKKLINYNLNAFYDCSFERVFYEGTVVDWCNTSFAIDDFNSCKSNPMLLSKENFFLDQDGDWYQPKELVIPDTVSEIKDYQFASLKNLKTIVISNSATRIGFAAFKNCSALEELTIPFVGESSDSVFNGYFGYIFGANKYIDNQVYVPSTLKELSITNATMIDTGAFKGCTKIESISISDTVTTIKNYAFEACSSLTSITLPNSLLNIGEGAFKYCDSLQYLIMSTNVKTIKKAIFEGILSTPIIYYLGTLDQWNQIEISENNDQIITNSNIPTVYFYSKDYPINTGFYWKFDDNDKPIKWTR